MKKFFLLNIVLLCSSLALSAQKLVKEISKLSDGELQIIEKNKNGDTLIIGTLSSADPETKNGDFIFYNDNKRLEAEGHYKKDIPRGIWNYYDTKGNIKRRIDYDRTADFLRADTLKSEKDVYSTVKDMPKFQNHDIDLFRTYIQENLVYPAYAAKENISGRVYLSLIIDENGKVSSVSVAKTSGNLDLDMEAIRVVSESPNWQPGKHRNVPVPVQLIIDIVFSVK